MSDLICYCFEFSQSDIETDFKKHGKSLILEKIIKEKKQNGCDCENKNPKGKWCLGDIHRVVNKMKGVNFLS